MEPGEHSNPAPPTAMIEIHEDSLRFSFPSIAAEVEGLLNAHVTAILPSFFAEDREKVIEEFLSARRAFGSSPDYQEKVRSVVCALSNEDIEKQLRKCVLRETESYGYNKAGRVEIEFQRTLRIPDDGRTHYLPPGLGRFPLRHVDDFADRVPKQWLERGGVVMPMYQAEALWLNFRGGYPFAIKIAAGKINAVSGEPWKEGLNRKPQDYVVTPGQRWLDGFAVEKGVIRQFVAMPLGAGYSVEEQLSGKAEFGGVQLQAIPMRARKYFESKLRPRLPKRMADILDDLIPIRRREHGICYSMSMVCEKADMGLGAGGRMRQQIFEDPYAPEDWDMEQSSRCFVHLCDALLWREITGENPPQTPVTAREYEKAGLPWFDYYRDDLAVLEGSKTLAGVKSVNTISIAKGDKALKGNESVEIPSVISCSPKKKTVKEWAGE
jgi:hypothetical protein